MITMPRYIRTDKKDHLSNTYMHTYLHLNGLSVTVIPKPKFHQKFVGLILPYGSAYNQFCFDHSKIDKHDIPHGTAYLLGKYIQYQELNSTDERMKQLIDASLKIEVEVDRDSTLFSLNGVDQIGKLVKPLWELVFEPVFDQQMMNQLKDTINSERVVLETMTKFKGEYQLLSQLYDVHGCRNPIQGHTDTLNKIDMDTIKKVHRAFYHPSGASIILVGDFEQSELCEILAFFDEKIQYSLNEQEQYGILIYPDEVEKPIHHMGILKNETNTKSFWIGIKDPKTKQQGHSIGANLIRHRLSGQLLMNTIIGPATELFEQLFHDRFINETFKCEYIRESDCSYVVLSGESDRPKDSVEAIIQAIVSYAKKGDYNEELFKLQRRVKAGHFMRSLDNVKEMGKIAAICRRNHIDLFDLSNAFLKITLDDAISKMKFLSDPTSYSYVICNQ